jgi:hypothetical protein
MTLTRLWTIASAAAVGLLVAWAAVLSALMWMHATTPPACSFELGSDLRSFHGGELCE